MFPAVASSGFAVCLAGTSNDSWRRLSGAAGNHTVSENSFPFLHVHPHSSGLSWSAFSSHSWTCKIHACCDFQLLQMSVARYEPEPRSCSIAIFLKSAEILAYSVYTFIYLPCHQIKKTRSFSPAFTISSGVDLLFKKTLACLTKNGLFNFFKEALFPIP